MPQLEWTDALTVGLPAIDDQHKQLFAICADLLESIDRGEGEAVLKDIFDRMKAYTEYHFKAEEAYMKSLDYPDLEAHASEHVLLLVRVNTLWRLLQSGENLSPQGVSLFLRDWIFEHVMHRDGQIGEFARSKS